MTQRERFIKTLKGEKIGGQVPHFELVFFLTMEAFGKVHPSQRHYGQWNQMSYAEKKLHIYDMADLYIETARRYDHDAIFVHPNPGDFDNVQWLLETIREKTGDTYYLMMHGDPTWSIPSGDDMMDFAAQMYEEPEKLNEISQRRVEQSLAFASKLDAKGHLLDGFALCSDYCFNVNPFFNEEKFDELIVPYLAEVIKGYRDLGYYTIKHTDGNIMPILQQMVDCKPDALHSLDPQGGVDLAEVKRLYGDQVTLIGNVNCGLLQTGTEEECRSDVLRTLKQGMEGGKGFIFSTSNCAYTGLPLERYEMMVDLWREYGNYDNQKW
ncbi:MAG: uroporphyrinogen decarboxylase family protein [Cellulosilyticaceae bacterium]